MKKVLALVLVAMMVIGMAPMTLAATATATTFGYSTTAGNAVIDGVSVRLMAGFKPADARPLDNTMVNRNDPRTDARLYLCDANGVNLTKTDVKALDLDVKTRISSGSKALDKVSIEYDGANAYIRVRFVNKFVSTGDLDYKFVVYLTQKKNRVVESEVEFEGTLKNHSQGKIDDYDYYYLYDYPVVEANEYIKLTELDLGEGVSIFAKLFEGKKYYGYASQKIQGSDDEVLAKYPAIGSVYYLDTIGLNSTGNYVKLDVSDKLYVYNADLEYIGTTADKLAYSTKYYVATEELDVDTAATDEPADGNDNEPAATNPDMGGDDVPENVNDNPGTGC